MTTHTLSLSRWHKVAERLSRSYTEITQSVRNTFVNTQVSGYLGESQVQRIQAKADQEAANLERAFALQDALIQIRKAIGEANARTGVSNELAEYDALIRRHKLLEAILVGQGSEMVSLEEIPALPSQIVSEDRYDRSKVMAKVRVLEPAKEIALRAQAEELLAKCYALADKISDLNRERLSIELPEDIAKAAGL